MELKYEITPDMVYGPGWEKLIEGYEVVRFDGDCKKGEWMLWKGGDVTPALYSRSIASSPLLILRKKRPRRWTFQECSQKEARSGSYFWVRLDDGCITAVSESEVVTFKNVCFVRTVNEVDPNA